MFTYILIGCFVVLITDYISVISMKAQGITSFLQAAFICAFWPLVALYLVVYFLGEIMSKIGIMCRKKG